MDWLSAWWNQYGAGHQLHIVAVAEGDQLLGVLPTYEHESHLGKQLRFLGSGAVCSDYLSAVVDPTCAEAVYKSLNDCMRESVSQSEIEALQLEGISQSDAWIPQLAKFADEAGYSIRVQPMVNSWSLPLPTSWSELQQSHRGRSVYRKAKKCFGRIESNEIVVRQLTHASELNEAMEHLIRLHQARRESVGDQGCFSDPRFEPFLREALGNMLASGTACISVCEKAGVVIGVALLLLGSDTVFMYQSGIDPNYMPLEPGHLTVTGCLLFAISKGHKNYDFLRGDEPYKTYWGAQAQPLQRIILAPPTLKAQTLEVVYRNLGWLKSCYSDLSSKKS
jgi:CelD/BcsL family acetyltransferase involved in cellulose biosynthesis